HGQGCCSASLTIDSEGTRPSVAFQLPLRSLEASRGVCVTDVVQAVRAGTTRESTSQCCVPLVCVCIVSSPSGQALRGVRATVFRRWRAVRSTAGRRRRSLAADHRPAWAHSHAHASIRPDLPRQDSVYADRACALLL